MCIPYFIKVLKSTPRKTKQLTFALQCAQFLIKLISGVPLLTKY